MRMPCLITLADRGRIWSCGTRSGLRGKPRACRQLNAMRRSRLRGERGGFPRVTIALCNRRSAAGRTANKQALRPRRKRAPWRSFSDGVDAKLDGGGLPSARRRVLSGADRQRECFRRTTTWTLIIGAPHVFTCQTLVRLRRASRRNCRVCAGPSRPSSARRTPICSCWSS